MLGSLLWISPFKPLQTEKINTILRTFVWFECWLTYEWLNKIIFYLYIEKLGFNLLQLNCVTVHWTINKYILMTYISDNPLYTKLLMQIYLLDLQWLLNTIFFTYGQTCIKRSPLGQRKDSIHMTFSMTGQEKVTCKYRWQLNTL
jgi:hypothetical protein